MNTQELRRLGVLPYEEEEPRWLGRDRRDIPHFTIERIEVNTPSRRMRGTWDEALNDAVERMSDEIVTEIDQEFLDEINNTVSDEPVNETVTVVEPVMGEQVNIMRRILQRFGRFRPNDN